MFIVDAVSSMTAVPLDFESLGIDVLLAGTQKAFALPPGLTVFTCSAAALAKAATVKDRGYYFDFVEFQKNAAENMTPSTPSIGHIFALSSKLDDFFTETCPHRLWSRRLATRPRLQASLRRQLRPPQRVRRKHPEVAVPMLARRWYQCRNPIQKLACAQARNWVDRLTHNSKPADRDLLPEELLQDPQAKATEIFPDYPD